MRVGAADSGMFTLLGRPAGERGVAGTAQQVDRIIQERRGLRF